MNTTKIKFLKIIYIYGVSLTIYNFVKWRYIQETHNKIDITQDRDNELINIFKDQTKQLENYNEEMKILINNTRDFINDNSSKFIDSFQDFHNALLDLSFEDNLHVLHLTGSLSIFYL